MGLNINYGAVVPGGSSGLTIASTNPGSLYFLAMQPTTMGTTTIEYVNNTLTFDPLSGTVNATAASAKYADLAEKYVSDSEYESGTVVIFGGDKEITITDISHDTRVAGVISTNPAYLMNDSIDGLPVALTGRVPCKVQGPVTKGSLLVTSEISGVARVLNNSQYQPGCIIGKSLENIEDSSINTIEIAVGRL
ncbi:hypothetical protein UFOVP257_22 [uncultured Caudovirales phage]|uniref:Uncharacterized protein n=1 Tax=uncultured Caudovirales phage TaxID=2100421 RepID=A0A6J5LIW1_9CAUD|nr:hypothetical protein UFOVP257_22 [uncultured Caudovirales phage]